MRTKSRVRIKVVGLCLVTVLLATVLLGCGGTKPSGASDPAPAESGTASLAIQSNAGQEAAPAAEELGFDTPFEFDELTITLGSGVTATTLNNQFSEHDGATVVSIPITLVNNASSTHGLNMFYFKVYAPDGTQLDDVSAFFLEDDVAWAGEARSGATTQSIMHILYGGPGDYYAEFSTPVDDDPIEVKLPLSF
jgi:hypothetical protein